MFLLEHCHCGRAFRASHEEFTGQRACSLRRWAIPRQRCRFLRPDKSPYVLAVGFGLMIRNP